MVQKGNRVINWQIVDTVDAAPHDWTSDADDEVDDENAVVQCHGSRCPLSKTKSY